MAESGKKLYVTAGGIGSIGQTIGTDPINPSNVNIPAKLWKVAVVLEANQSILDINGNNDVIAVILPNDATNLGSNDGKQWAKDGSQDGIGRVKLSQIESLTGFDLLSNIHAPVLKQQLRNKVYGNPYLSSPLQADLDNSQNLSTTFIGSKATIAHNGILEQRSTLDSKVAYRIEQTGIFENSPTSVTASNIGSFQIGSGEVGTINNSVPEIALGQDSVSEIGTTQIRTKQYSSSQINSSQIRFFGETDINKVSLPSSISVKQLFNSDIGGKDKTSQFMPLRGGSILVHSPSLPLTPVLDSPVMFSEIDGQLIHDNTSLLTSIYSTAQSLWHSNTAIDLNFAITNLPTGQLAEGTITSYNTNGTPKTATITIDDDANGVGWFVDSTPGDNSEFRAGVGELGSGGVGEYFQAAPNSTAAGKYDLLTAILHEMGHTFGIINGYSEFDKHIKNGKFIPTDAPTGAKITLTPDGSHLDSTLYPYDLMNTSLKPGICYRNATRTQTPIHIRSLHS